MSRSTAAWVNTTRRAIPWYQKIRAELDLSRPIQVTKTGHRWGLTCNGIHFVDLVQWWIREQPLHVDTSGILDWFPSKRPSFHEAAGTIRVNYDDTSSLILVDKQEYENESLVLVDTPCESWTIDEDSGLASSDRGKTIRGRIPFQSELTAPVVDGVLTTGECCLPTIHDAVAGHRPYLAALVSNWNTLHNRDQSESRRVPIT